MADKTVLRVRVVFGPRSVDERNKIGIRARSNVWVGDAALDAFNSPVL